MLAPVILFVYNRPFHTSQSLQALALNDLAQDTKLIIYADGINKEADSKNVQEVRKIIRQKMPFKSVEIIESDNNKGLMNSIIDGVTETINQYEKVIVLEDDLLTSKGFLNYMNDALNFYEKEQKVMHISGYMFPVRNLFDSLFNNFVGKIIDYDFAKNISETVFYQSTSCWSWATWKDRWNFYNPNAEDLYKKLNESGKMYRFDLDGSNQFKSQLEMNISKKRLTWSIKWEASVHLEGGLCLHPTQTMVKNIGHEGSGSSFDSSGLLATQNLRNYTKVAAIPLIENQKLREQMKLYYALDGKMTTKRILFYYLKKYLLHNLKSKK